MITPAEFNRIKAKIDKVEEQKQRSQGALEQQLKQLKSKFNCNSVEEAQRKLKEKKREREKLEQKFTKAYKQFRRDYKKFLASIKEGA